MYPLVVTGIAQVLFPRQANGSLILIDGKLGFLSIIAATGLFVASNGFAADAHQRVDVIETLNERVAQLDSMKARGEWVRVDVIGSMGSEGPVYPYTTSMRVDVIGTIHEKEVKVSEGPVYPYTKSMSR